MYIVGVLITLNQSSGNIEVRKVQLTGGSTYTVSLPKRWVDEMSLSPRDGIRIDWRPSGALRLTPIDMANNQEKRVSIDAKSLPKDSLHDHLMGAYLSGADTIRVRYPEKSEREYRKQIRRFLKNTRGFETINEHQNGVELICLIGASEMPLSASINRMYLQLTSVVRDIISISEGDDIDLLSDVNDRESEVDALQGLTGQFAIGVNNRNLTSFVVDLQTAITLYEPIRQAFPGHPVVAESGYTCGQELQTIADLGYDAVLIGEGLVDETRDLRAWFANQTASQS